MFRNIFKSLFHDIFLVDDFDTLVYWLSFPLSFIVVLFWSFLLYLCLAMSREARGSGRNAVSEHKERADLD